MEHNQKQASMKTASQTQVDEWDLPEVCIERMEHATVQRRIVCAAIRVAGIPIPSARHGSPAGNVIGEEINRLRAALGEPLAEVTSMEDFGFIDQFDNYWKRDEAFIIAKHAGQINKYRPTSPVYEGELYSENLY